MDSLSEIPQNVSDLDNFLAQRESEYDLKPRTEANIIWNSGSSKHKTEYAIVYLHGFRASHPEGDPVHRTIAQTFSYNLFLSRMEEHGITSEYPLRNLTVEKMLRSARFALAMGQKIGHKVILMGTSTGASLALWLASQRKFEQSISSLILYSPLIRFYGFKQQAMMSAFTRKTLRYLLGSNYLITTSDTTYAQDRIWNKSYALEGALALGTFVERYMKYERFAKINCPVFTGYYYKNKYNQDKVVSVPAIKKMVKHLGTRTELIKSMNFPEAQNHVICSSLLSKMVPDVTKATISFMKNVGSHRASNA